MIVKDGASTLARCLESVKSLVDEIVIVDTGSTDETARIARSFGAEVHSFTWTDSFADARNAALKPCQGDWIFWLDADEWLAPENQSRFATLTRQLPVGKDFVYLIDQVSEHASESSGEPGDQDLVVSQARLFPNLPGLVWRYRVHEQILPSCNAKGLKQARVPIAIRHSGYADERLRNAKEERNRPLLRQELEKNPDDTWVLYQLGRIQARSHQDEARTVLRRALEKTGPDDALRRRIHGLLVEIEMTGGEPAEALRLVDTALAEIPNDTLLLSHAGRLAFEAGDLDRAARHFQTLLETEPAPEEFFQGVDRSQRGWRTRHNLAVVRHQQSRQAEAEVLWKQNAGENTDPKYSWIWLARYQFEQERYEELFVSIEHLENSNDIDILIFLIIIHQSLDQFDKAAAILNRWISLEKEKPTPWPIVKKALARFRPVDEDENAQAIEPDESKPLTIEVLQGMLRYCESQTDQGPT